MTDKLPDLVSILEAHPLSKRLRAEDADATLTDAVLDIPVADRADTFTTGTLETAFVRRPAVLVSRKTKSILAVFCLGPKFMGHRGFVHGGAMATIFDECCGRSAVCHFESVKLTQNGDDPQGRAGIEGYRSAAVTAQLELRYLAPVPTGSSVLVHAIVDDSASSERKAIVAAKLWRLQGHEVEDDRDDTLCATAQSLFIEPKQF